MLQKLKRLLVVGVAALSIAFAGVNIANAGPQPKDGPGFYEHSVTGAIKYFKSHPGEPSQWILIDPVDLPCGGDCVDVAADAMAGIDITFPAVSDIKTMGYSQAGGNDLVLEAEALATGQVTHKLVWVQDGRRWWQGHFEIVEVPAEGYASATAYLQVKTHALVFSTGVKNNGGWSKTAVLGIGILKFNADAYATGDFGCLQIASASLSGEFGAKAGGWAASYSVNGSGAVTEAFGSTIVGVVANDFEADKYDFKWWIFPTDVVADAGISGTVIVKQGLLVMAYTSPDGMTTRNFGIITGGSAYSFGDANFTSVRASGNVSQHAIAVGPGALAYGNSQAAYLNAGGSVYNGCISSAQASGLAVVTGYNNIVHNGNTLTVTSHQTAYATTGSPGYQGPQ